MYKAKPRLMQMALENRIKYGVATYSPILNADHKTDHRKSLLNDVQGYENGQAITMFLNKAGRNNVLTNQMIKEIHRHLESYQIDESIQLVYLESRDSEVFSHGMDYFYLY